MVGRAGTGVELEAVESDRGSVTIDQARVNFDAGNVFGTDHACDVDVTGLERGQDGVDVRDRAIREAVEVGKACSPVARVLLQCQVVVALPLDERERTAACVDRSQRKVGSTLVDGVHSKHRSSEIEESE